MRSRFQPGGPRQALLHLPCRLGADAAELDKRHLQVHADPGGRHFRFRQAFEVFPAIILGPEDAKVERGGPSQFLLNEASDLLDVAAAEKVLAGQHGVAIPDSGNQGKAG